jgi:hypothetical protein
MPTPHDWACRDCGGVNDDYTVLNAVWEEAWPGCFEEQRLARLAGTKVRCLLCFRCLEARLGRPLAPSDFSLAMPINRGIAIGIAMARRSALPPRT